MDRLLKKCFSRGIAWSPPFNFLDRQQNLWVKTGGLAVLTRVFSGITGQMNAGRSQNGPSRHLNTEFHIIHLPCKCLENAPQAAFWPNIYPQILLTSRQKRAKLKELVLKNIEVFEFQQALGSGT